MLSVKDHELTSIAPQFLVDDLPTACSYYKDKLGFNVDFIYEGFYAGLSRDSVVLHLKCAPKTVSDRQHRKDNEHLDAHVSSQGCGWTVQRVSSKRRNSYQGIRNSSVAL